MSSRKLICVTLLGKTNVSGLKVDMATLITQRVRHDTPPYCSSPASVAAPHSATHHTGDHVVFARSTVF